MQNLRAVFISSSRDMTGWAALTITQIRDFAERHGLTDINVVDYRDIDPANIDHATTWQDSVGAPSRLDTALTIMLIGERIGTPLPATFRLKQDIFDRLQRDGYHWIHVNGLSPDPIRSDQVPLTGTLFEYFDAFLPRADGSHGSPLRVMLKGSYDDFGEPDFGNGEYRLEIEASGENAGRKRQLRKEYDQQLEWLNLFWSKLYGLQQHANLFCINEHTFITKLESILTAEFLSRGDYAYASIQKQIDPHQVDLPGPTPYDLERAMFFLGRGPQIAELSRRAINHQTARRLVPVIGESGTGKSSLLRAGLLNDALSPVRRRFGWRTAFLSLSDLGKDQSPLMFLAEVLAGPSALPELGTVEALKQRLDGVVPEEAAKRLLEILAALNIPYSPGLGRPKLLVVVDQLEFALDNARMNISEMPSSWQIFLNVLAAMGDGLFETKKRSTLEELSIRFTSKLPCTVVTALPSDRFNALTSFLRPGDLTFHLPRLVDETALREVVTGTFSILGLKIEPAAQEALCREAVEFALRTEASVLPLLSVNLAALHADWKKRSETESLQKRKGIPVIIQRFDIEMTDIVSHGCLDRAIARLGELAWDAAKNDEVKIAGAINALPISRPKQQALSGEITMRDFALARLLRRLIAVSSDNTMPDRLTALPDNEIEQSMRPLAEALRYHRLLTRHDDGSWWLVHQSVITSWARAAVWRKTEAQAFKTKARLRMDFQCWQEEIAVGVPDANRLLWTRDLQIDLIIDLMMLHGANEDQTLERFAKNSMIAAAGMDGARAGRILRAATYLDDIDWCKAILEAAGNSAQTACNYRGSSPCSLSLINACVHADSALVELLLQNGANPNLRLADGTNSLNSAASVGSLKICKLDLQQ